MSKFYFRLFLGILLIGFLLLLIFGSFRFTGYGILDAGSVGGSIQLSWVDSSSNEEGFSIERSDYNINSFLEIGTVGQNVNSYTDSNVVLGEIYFYRVRAFNSNFTSAYSNIVNITVPLNETNTSVIIPSSVPGSSSTGGSSGSSGSSGGSGGGNSGGLPTGFGGVTGNAVSGSSENPEETDENPETENPFSQPEGEPIGSNLISGRAISDNIESGNVSLVALAVLVLGALLFLFYKAIHLALSKIFLKKEDNTNV